MADWNPPRPERVRPPWSASAQDPDALLPRAVPPHGTPPPPAEAEGPRSRAPRLRRLRALSPARRVAVAGLALIAAVALVTGIGTALTPAYGDLSPYGTTAVADLRSEPTAIGWTTDLARDVLPGVPVRCATFTSSQPTGRYVVVTGESPPLGSTRACSPGTQGQVASTLALLDSETGRVIWSRDLSSSFPTRSGSIQLDAETVVRKARSVVVQLTADERIVVASLSFDTGDVQSSTALASGASSSQPGVSGRLVLYGQSASREGATEWTLADARHVDQPVWQAELDDALPPILTSSGAFARLDGKSARIDGTTGRVTRLGDGTVDLTGSLGDGGGILTTDSRASGLVITAWSADGRRVWARSGLGALAGLTRDCVMVALTGTSKGTCLDRATGRARWTADIATGSFAFPLAGQTTDDVVVYRNKGDATELDFFDGGSGHLRFPLSLPPVTFTLIASRTVGYLQISSDSGSPTGITGFDLTSGRQLWTIDESETRDMSFWGGQLVRVTKDGVAHQLTDRPHRVLGE